MLLLLAQETEDERLSSSLPCFFVETSFAQEALPEEKQEFEPRVYAGMALLPIIRKYFDEIVAGRKKYEFRADTSRIQSLAQRKHLMFKNGRCGKCPYVIVEITGSSESSLQAVREAHGEEALKIFDQDSSIRALHLGSVVEVWDPKRYTFYRNTAVDLGPCTGMTTSPIKHATRSADLGPLPLDLQAASLKRRNLAGLPSQSVEESFEAFANLCRQVAEFVEGPVKSGHKPVLLSPMTLTVGSRFSGIGSCEEAFRTIEPHIPLAFDFLYACDTDTDVCKFYQHRFGSNHHFFKDVYDLAPTGNLPIDKDVTFTEKMKQMKSVVLKKTSKCQSHDTRCSIPQVHMDISGSPCVDYSAQGSRRGTEGKNVNAMLLHFCDLQRRQIPIRVSENVVDVEGQTAIASAMNDCEIRYIITMPEDVGMGSVRRDRGWIVGVAPPFRFFQDPNLLYEKLAGVLSQKQVSQSALWFEDDEGLQQELRGVASRFRHYTEGCSLSLS